MFETVRIHTRVGEDGRLHVDLALPPRCEVDVVVSERAHDPFENEAAWQSHIDSVVGSLPNIERPPQPALREIGPL